MRGDEYFRDLVAKQLFSRSLGLLNPPDAHTIREDANVEQALEVLQFSDATCLVVVDKAERCVGTFSLRELYGKFDADFSKLLLSEVMHKEPQLMEMTWSIGAALISLVSTEVRDVVIVDRDLPVAVLSARDILCYLREEFDNFLGARVK